MIDEQLDVINAAAHLEGWAVFTCSGSDNGPYQIQRLDAPDEGEAELATDEAAWLLVIRGIEPHHIAPMNFIKEHNPQEWEAISKFVTKIADGRLTEETFK